AVQLGRLMQNLEDDTRNLLVFKPLVLSRYGLHETRVSKCNETFFPSIQRCGARDGIFGQIPKRKAADNGQCQEGLIPLREGTRLTRTEYIGNRLMGFSTCR